MDKRDFDRIIKDKERNRDRLDELKADLSVFLYSSLIGGKNLTETLKGLGQIIRDTELKHLKNIRSTTAKMARIAYRQASAPSKDPKGEIVKAVTKDSLIQPWEKAENEWLRTEEAEQRDKVLEDALKEPEKVDNIDDFRCFCLASRHDDCAADHIEYQGKLYVKRWALRYPEIKKYCEARQIKTVEWVIKKPAWLTTRPNCRHFFKDLTWKEVRGTEIDVLLKEYGADRVVGSKGTWQSIRHITRKQWYTESNVRGIIKKYKERLKRHERMAEVYENENLRNEIQKDRLLIRKWEIYYRSMVEKGTPR